MNPDLPTDKSDATVISNPNGIFDPIKKYLVFIILVIVILVAGSLGVYLWKQQSSIANPSVNTLVQSIQEVSTPVKISAREIPYEVENGLPLAPTTEIAKVGEEKIYQNDLEHALILYPPNTSSTINKVTVITDKIARDSIILQAGQKMGLVKLDLNIYNSPMKDYAKRAQAVNEVIKKVEGQADSISGTVVSIWFYNVKPAEVGFEQGKEIAFAKISQLQANVKAKKITVAQAVEAIKNDSSLAKVDVAYKTNAGSDFRVSTGQRITFIEEFDKMIWILKSGEVTDVYLGKDFVNNGLPMDALYMFAQVNERKQNNTVLNFEDWFNTQKKVYEITYY